jgi:hypothetical protein
MFTFRFRILYILLLFLGAPAVHASFRDGLVALHQGEIDRGFNILDAIESNDPDFLDALVEQQKVLYMRGEWQKFFGRAVFYRKKYLATPQSAKLFYRSRMIALELMGLIKHCQWSVAQKLAKQALLMGKAVGARELQEIEETITLFGLTEAFPALSSVQADSNKPAIVFDRELLWPIESIELKNIDHPRELRLIVTNRCSS